MWSDAKYPKICWKCAYFCLLLNITRSDTPAQCISVLEIVQTFKLYIFHKFFILVNYLPTKNNLINNTFSCRQTNLSKYTKQGIGVLL